jgi:hypothetical protein
MMSKINPAEPPDLSYSIIRSIVLNDTPLSPRLNYWNRLLLTVIGEAAKTLPKNQVSALVICGCVAGKRKTSGFHYVVEADISVQAQNANVAWRATYHILKATRMSAEIVFGWHKPGSDSETAPARMLVNWNT